MDLNRSLKNNTKVQAKITLKNHMLQNNNKKIVYYIVCMILV